MTTIKGLVLSALAAAVLAGCGEKKIECSSVDTCSVSVEQIEQDMKPEEISKFKNDIESLIYLSAMNNYKANPSQENKIVLLSFANNDLSAHSSKKEEAVIVNALNGKSSSDIHQLVKNDHITLEQFFKIKNYIEHAKVTVAPLKQQVELCMFDVAEKYEKFCNTGINPDVSLGQRGWRLSNTGEAQVKAGVISMSKKFDDLNLKITFTPIIDLDFNVDNDWIMNME
jgi:hypothetical protein